MKAVSRKDFVPNENSNTCVVCSLHFVDSDYSNSTKRRRLKPDAVPSVFSDNPHYVQPTPPKKRHESVRQLSISRKKTVTSTLPKEGRKENAADNLHSEDFCTSVVSANILSNHPSTTAKLGPDNSDATHQAVVSVEAAVQADFRIPRKHPDVRAINRMRAQISRNNSTIQKLREENERLKKKLEMFENISQCIQQEKDVSRGCAVEHFVLKLLDRANIESRETLSSVDLRFC